MQKKTKQNTKKKNKGMDELPEKLKIKAASIKWSYYTSQLKYIFQVEENMSRAVGQSSLTP